MARTHKQLSFEKVNGWGGKRRGAGRPNRSKQVNHMKRPKVKATTPMHLTWRLKKDLLNLRSREAEQAFQKGAKGCKRFGLAVIHYSLQKDHIHLVVEAKNNESLTRGMRSFGSTFGKALRKVCGGKGSVFDGRFHLHLLENPTKVKNAMAYVLQNYSKHTGLLKHLDRYSSAAYFGEWKKLMGPKAGPILQNASRPPPLPDFLSEPRSWLASQGWRRAPARIRS